MDAPPLLPGSSTPTRTPRQWRSPTRRRSSALGPTQARCRAACTGLRSLEARAIFGRGEACFGMAGPSQGCHIATEPEEAWYGDVLYRARDCDFGHEFIQSWMNTVPPGTLVGPAFVSRDPLLTPSQTPLSYYSAVQIFELEKEGSSFFSIDRNGNLEWALREARTDQIDPEWGDRLTLIQCRQNSGFASPRSAPGHIKLE